MSPHTQPVCLMRLAVAVASLLLLGSERAAVSKEPEAARVALYDGDPNHLWNRVHSTLLIRIGPDGRPYGEDRLEPLLWTESEYLLKGISADLAVAVLEEFVRDRGESLIHDPVKKAILQRDLALVLNWLTRRSGDAARARLEALLASVIRQVALRLDQIAQLPDNYTAASASKRFADRFDPDKPDRSYLPPHLFAPDSSWVCVGRTDGPTAPRHLDESGDNRFTNSVFLIFLKFPSGRDATLDFLQRLAAFDKPLYLANTDDATRRFLRNLPNPTLPHWPQGTEVVLLRRAMLVDSNGRIVASPLTESVQLRVMRTETPAMTAKAVNELYAGARDAQAFAEFQLRRTALFAGEAGGLRDVSGERDFKTGFNSHGWDEFGDPTTRATSGRPFPERSQLFANNRASCFGCHQYPGVYSFNSFHADFPFTVSRDLNNEGPGGYQPKAHALAATSVETVEQAALKWQAERRTWKALRSVWPE